MAMMGDGDRRPRRIKTHRSIRGCALEQPEWAYSRTAQPQDCLLSMDTGIVRPQVGDFDDRVGGAPIDQEAGEVSIKLNKPVQTNHRQMRERESKAGRQCE